MKDHSNLFNPCSVLRIKVPLYPDNMIFLDKNINGILMCGSIRPI